MSLPIPAAGVSAHLPYAAAPLPVPLLQAAATTAMPAPTGMLSGASAAVPVPALDAVPVPWLEAGLLLRGCATRRPLRCHVMLLRVRWRPGGLLAAT